jgi:hypothetical protein
MRFRICYPQLAHRHLKEQQKKRRSERTSPALPLEKGHKRIPDLIVK